jgi:hypothetical protein
MHLHSTKEDPECCFEFLVEQLKSGEFDMIFPIPEKWLSCFPENLFWWEYNPDDSDYLYSTDKLIELSGKKLQKKRNLISQFIREFDEPQILPLGPETLESALQILDLWQQASPDEINVSDYCQCKEALGDIKGFDLSGALFLAKGVPAGFILGEPLNDQTFTIHFAKGLTQFKGIYPLMFNRFTKEFLSKYKYMNMEQDLGKPGLRQTKRSFVPDLMAHKYRIYLK